jgi:hypothetical protein
MKRISMLLACLALFLFSATAFASPQHDDSSMNTRGDHVMGFDHDKTTHHFILSNSGGAIQVQANSPSDSASRDHIRMHLQHIAKAFAAGDFEDPMEVHAQVPPGVPVMKDSKSKISYRYESIDRGGTVVILTHDPAALKAVHDYLRFQIQEHKTGDPLTVQ